MSLNFAIMKSKHRHARRPGAIFFFCELKGFGESRIKSMTCDSNLKLPQINIDNILFSNRQFDSFFDTTHTGMLKNTQIIIKRTFRILYESYVYIFTT